MYVFLFPQEIPKNLLEGNNNNNKIPNYRKRRKGKDDLFLFSLAQVLMFWQSLKSSL